MRAQASLHAFAQGQGRKYTEQQADFMRTYAQHSAPVHSSNQHQQYNDAGQGHHMQDELARGIFLAQVCLRQTCVRQTCLVLRAFISWLASLHAQREVRLQRDATAHPDMPASHAAHVCCSHVSFLRLACVTWSFAGILLSTWVLVCGLCVHCYQSADQPGTAAQQHQRVAPARQQRM